MRHQEAAVRVAVAVAVQSTADSYGAVHHGAVALLEIHAFKIHLQGRFAVPRLAEGGQDEYALLVSVLDQMDEGLPHQLEAPAHRALGSGRGLLGIGDLGVRQGRHGFHYAVEGVSEVQTRQTAHEILAHLKVLEVGILLTVLGLGGHGGGRFPR